MKLSILLTCMFSANLLASVYSQTARFSLEIKDQTVRDVLKTIEKTSEFRFFYNEEFTDLNKKVTLAVNDQPIDDFLPFVLGETEVSYKILDNNFIVITPKSMLQQQRRISGTVKDSRTGEPLAGVTVSVENTNQGILTDGAGRYSLELSEASVSLSFSFIGYEPQKVTIDNQSVIDIELSISYTELDDVVVVGYGTQRKKDLTGAVSRLSMGNKDELPIENAVQLLRGSIAGVNVSVNGKPGDDGTINIRGLKSLLGSTRPLIVVDGIPMEGGAALSDINPNDIESMDILKDAASAAVYGARSTGGVILITIKRGTSSKPTIRYNAYYGKQDFSNRLHYLDGPEYIQKVIDYEHAIGVANPDPTVYMKDLENLNYAAGKTVDPIAFVIQDAPIMSHDLSIAGKTDRTTYFLSGSLMDDHGLVYNDNFRRITLRSNLESKITDWLSVGLNASFVIRDASGAEGTLGSMLSPYSEMYMEDGVTLRKLVHGGGEAMGGNPLWAASRREDLDINNNLGGNLYAIVDFPFVKGLSYRMNYANTFNWYKHYIYNPTYFNEGQNDIGDGSIENTNRYYYLIENILTYKKQFAGIHNIEATALYSFEHNELSQSRVSSSNFSTNALGYNALQIGTVPVINYTNASVDNTISMMGRINYRFKDRYLVTLLARRDGYSAFGSGNKFGLFPSAALAWIISEESFMGNVKLINNLKLRLSYGANGNKGIAPYSSLASMGIDAPYVFGNGSSTYIGYYVRTMENPSLRWETTVSANIGLDFAILNDRLSGSIEYYSTKTEDLLITRKIPIMTGFPSVNSNLGGISNKGLEVTLNSVNVALKDFLWTSNVVFYTNKNKITSIYGVDMNEDGIEDDDIANNWFIGQPIGAIFNYTWDGIWQVGDANIPVGFKPGDCKVLDIDNVPGINQGDRSIIGKTTPDFRFGVGNTFDYKNFSLFVFVNASVGGEKSNSYYNPNNYFADRLNIYDYGDYWTPENPINTRPSVAYTNPLNVAFNSSLTYVRIQDVSLSYDLPRSLLSNIKIEALKVYVSGKNLFTFTDWTGWDPEIDGIPRSSVGPTDSGAEYRKIGGYPMVKSIIAGLNVSF